MQSITFRYQGLYTVTQVGAQSTGKSDLTAAIGPRVDKFPLYGKVNQFENGLSLFTFDQSTATSSADELAYFTRAGLIDSYFQSSDGVNAHDSSAGLNVTITYNYTPAVVSNATPEPSSFALLGTGLIGALGIARKRFAR